MLQWLKIILGMFGGKGQTSLSDGLASPSAPPATKPSIDSSSGEDVRLLIWDLDETFWIGTLEEEGVTIVQRNIGIVRTLAERGIVSSIASKNHFARAREVLQRAGIWDYFIMPQIAFQPKGELVSALIETCQLRAASVMFVDDNLLNLNEVRHYNKDIQTSLPAILPIILADPRFTGGKDPDLTRLKKYKIIEQRESERAATSSDNTEFLRLSQIRVSIHHDVLDQFDRVHELVNRTNQMNFTKKRLATDIGEARSSMERLLSTEYNCRAAYVKVADKYGFYGICGFYMMRNYSTEHFLFSCRVMNMGVEQKIHQILGRPLITPVGDVTSDLSDPASPDWISVVDDAEAGTLTASEPKNRQQSTSICLRGGCELSQTAHYLRERHVVDEEFPFPNGAWGIQTPLTDYIALMDAYDKPEYSQLFSYPWFDRKVLESQIFSRSSDCYVLSFGIEPYVTRFRHKPSGLIFPMDLGGHNMADLTKLRYDEILETTDPGLTENDWVWFQAEFERAWRFNPDFFQANLIRCLDHIADKQIIVLLTNTRHGPFHAINDFNARVNEIVERVVADRQISLIRLNDFINSDREVLEMNHFRREVYMRLSDAIGRSLAERTIPSVLRAVPTEASSTLADQKPRHNMLPAAESLTGRGWRALPNATVAPADHEGRYPDFAVMRHQLSTSLAFPDWLVFGCYLPEYVLPDQMYVVSIWVLIPKDFRGTEISVVCAGLGHLGIVRASLYVREKWQRIWSCVRIPSGETNLFPALAVEGRAGSVIYSTAWKLELGSVPTASI